MSGVAAGKLKHYITLERPTYAQDQVTGAMEPKWEKVAQVWADISPASAREFIAARAEQSEVLGKVVIRYRGDIDSRCRIRYRRRIYAILGVMPDNDSMREHMTMMVSEGVREE